MFGSGGTVLPLWSRPASGFPAEFNWVFGCTYKGMPTARAYVRNMIGANMSFRRQAIIGVGGFRDGIGRVGARPVGCEETELCIRIHQAHPLGRVLHQPQAMVRHHVPASRLEWRYFMARCYSEGLSKALLCQLGGAQKGLSSERAYVTRTLPRGFICGLSDGFLHADREGFLRSARIASGLLLTMAGFIMGWMKLRLGKVIDA